MVDAAGALQRALGRRLVVEVEAAPRLAARLPALAGRLELERLEQAPRAGLRRGAVGAHRVEALQRELGRDLGVIGDQRLVGDIDDEQLVVEPLRVGEDEALALALGLDPGGGEPLRPEVERVRGGDAPDDPVDHPGAGPAQRRAGNSKKVRSEPALPLLVGVEEVVDGRVVLVDRFLDQPQAQHPGVEVDVALRVLGDRGDVVDSLQLHWSRIPSRAMSRGRRRTVKALVVLGSVLAFLSVFAIWTERQALNTDDWVHTSDRLIQNSTIRSAVGDYLVDQLYENVDVEKELKEILPGDTKELAGPAAGGLRQVAGTGAEKVLETSTAQCLWEDANRTAHEQLLAVLENKKEAVSTKGNVSLNLGSLVTNLAEPGRDRRDPGRKAAARRRPDHDPALRPAEDRAEHRGRGQGPGAGALDAHLRSPSAARSTSRAEGRWVTVLFCGIGLIAAGFAVIVARQVAGGIVVDQLVTDESVKPAGEAAWSIATSLMTSIATTVIVVGVLFAGSPAGSPRRPAGESDAAATWPRPCASTPPTSTPAWRSSSASTSSPRRPRACAPS